MKKEITIKEDFELKRQQLYDLIDTYINEGYHFNDRCDYNWFVNTITKPNKELFILCFEDMNIETDFVDRQFIYISYVWENNVEMVNIYLSKKIDGFLLKDFQKGEQ